MDWGSLAKARIGLFVVRWLKPTAIIIRHDVHFIANAMIFFNLNRNLLSHLQISKVCTLIAVGFSQRIQKRTIGFSQNANYIQPKMKYFASHTPS
ncbi:MAG: hypothetical protein JWR05_1509 [Mucilaginibacter sp.]|nr:hypothetical protein [Mucilaginibacter sp.]